MADFDHALPPVRLDGSGLSFDDFIRATRIGQRLELDPQAAARLDENQDKFLQAIRSGRRMYGVNTGFADNRDSPLLPAEDMSSLQENLIRSHASGYGPIIPDEVVRGAIAVRAASLSRGYSGVRSEVVTKLLELYNLGLVPAIPCFGSVGASGDLAPLSHLAMALIGEAKEQVIAASVLQGASDRMPRDESERWASFVPLSYESDGTKRKLGPKEGLALNNGTAFMASWLGISVFHAENLLAHARLALAMTMEALFGLTQPFASHVQALRSHSPIAAEAEALLEILQGSKCVRWPGGGERTPASIHVRPDDVQDDYSLRCAAVAHGAARGSIAHVKEVVEAELNAVTDNPMIFTDEGWADEPVQSGAHFHGAILALPADYLRCAITEIAGVSERRIAKLIDKARNYGLPNYLAREGGIESALMITQYTAASILNDLKTKCMPHGVDSIPTGNNSEDYVSMGANACRATYESLDSAYGIVAIELLTATRALNLRLKGSSEIPAVPEDHLSAKTNAVRVSLTEALGLGDLDSKGDVPLAWKIQTCVDLIKSRDLL